MSIAFSGSAPLLSRKPSVLKVAISAEFRAGNGTLITTRERQDDAGDSTVDGVRGGAGRHGWAGAGGDYYD